MSEKFLKVGNDYTKYVVYQKAMCIYDLTCYFTKKFLHRGDRTVDQMVQAARSGKQNIAEGIADASTSAEMGIKLINSAKGSLKELREDYQDYLRNRRLSIWEADDPRQQRTRRLCRIHSETEFYQNRIDERSDEAISNIATKLVTI